VLLSVLLAERLVAVPLFAQHALARPPTQDVQGMQPGWRPAQAPVYPTFLLRRPLLRATHHQDGTTPCAVTASPGPCAHPAHRQGHDDHARQCRNTAAPAPPGTATPGLSVTHPVAVPATPGQWQWHAGWKSFHPVATTHPATVPPPRRAHPAPWQHHRRPAPATTSTHARDPPCRACCAPPIHSAARHQRQSPGLSGSAHHASSRAPPIPATATPVPRSESFPCRAVPASVWQCAPPTTP